MNKKILENIYHNILELSDKKKQQELWLGRSQGYVSSYLEVMSRLFDDNDFDLFLDKEYPSSGLSYALRGELFILRDLLNAYQNSNTDQEILNDSKWDKIITQAQKVITSWDAEKDNI